MIALFQPSLSDKAIADVARVLGEGRFSEGPRVLAFEQAFTKRFAVPHAIAVNSGTAALELALRCAGVGPGDEVVTTAQTFVGTALAVLGRGATPVFADIEPDGPNLSVADAERRVTDRTRAVLVVHYGGQPCDVDGVLALAARHHLRVVEDAAHALGARHRGREVGALGDCGIFSFQSIKQLTTGDGGMLVCRDPAMADAARRWRWFGIDRRRRKPTEIGEHEYDISELGGKLHMNDITATIGSAELERFDAALARTRAIAARYQEMLDGLDGLRLLATAPGTEPTWWLFTVLVERRLDFIRALRGRGVEAAVWHQRIDRHSIFGGRSDLPNLARFDARQVAIPCRASLGDDEVERVVAAVRAGW